MELTNLDDEDPDDLSGLKDRDVRALHLIAYYIDFDGYSHKKVERIFRIRSYDGEMDITSHEVYPMRFVKDAEKIKLELQEQGEKFQNAIKLKHLYYDGWTLVSGPAGDADLRVTTSLNRMDRLDRLANILIDTMGKSYSYAADQQNMPEHIDGDVMIDFTEGYKAKSSISMPNFSSKNFHDDDWPKGYDCTLTRYYADGPQSEILGGILESTIMNDLVSELVKDQYEQHGHIFQQQAQGENVATLKGDDNFILPRRAVAYAFRERKFVMVDVHGLRPIPTPKNVFGDLKIDVDHKRIIKSLVKAHFRKRKLQKQESNVGLNQDLIKGKGAGLFILLHGVPGVGKTATAEAVAQSNKKPLFVITCGDLGFAPKEVDQTLRDIFRLAHLWDCVLLLDEADIFLSRRETSDLQRNTLVSIFLRVLEYYSGILFLTTNRVGALDEAFKSRIHISLYYPKLNKQQTMSIFEVNIEKLREIEKEKQVLESRVNPDASKRPELIIDERSIMHYAEWLYDSYEQDPHQRWNGRQIRNAFQIAYSLADFDLQKTSLEHWEEEDAGVDMRALHATTAADGRQRAPKLDHQHFAIVAKTIENFDRYLEDAMAGTDIDHARATGIRADDHDPRHWKERPAYRAPYQGDRHQSDESTYRRPRPGASGNFTHPSQSRGGYRQTQPQHGYVPQKAVYEPPQDEYQPPGPAALPRMKGRAAPEESSRHGNPRFRARGSVSKITPRSKPLSRGQDDSGYSGWSTNSAPNPALRNEEYEPRYEAEGEYHDLEYPAGEGPYYEEEEER